LPTNFGKYSILGHLATGGMAEVYLARQAGLHGFEKIVVIKRVRPELTADPEATKYFLDEARLVATLEHPNIAQVYEIGLVNDSYFFVMEYVHGADLRQLMEAAVTKRVKVSLADSVYIMIGVCAALHYAHEKRDREGKPLSIIHRDVSPSNVLISHDGAIKVCDFGIAKAENRTTETTRGVIKGKFAYMSPEQCRSQPLDRRSDVFSIGILLYELSTLSRLFIANSDFDLLRSIIEEEAPPPSSRTRGYSLELERIVLKALSKNPDDRYTTAQAMQLDLEAFARENKLGMSSVNIAALMGALFEKRIDAWLKAQQQGQDLAEYLLDTSVEKEKDDLPVFLPVGTNETTDPIDIEETGVHPRTSQAVAMVAAPSTMPTRHATAVTRAGPNHAWLVGALVAVAAVVGVTVASPHRPGGVDRNMLEADAKRIDNVLDDIARNMQQRASNVAIAPLVRAAIETDAATVHDLATNDHVLAPGPNEVTELFQRRNGTPVSLIRIPPTAAPLEAPAVRTTRFKSDGSSLFAIAGAAVTGPSGIEGTFAIASPVDLAFAKAALADHADKAVLVGLGRDLVLVGTSTAGEQVIVPLANDRGHLVIVPIEKAAAGAAWIDPARIAAGLLAAVLFVVYLFGFRRGRDATVPPR
jgi:serine/threonine protein kinase